MPRTCYFLPFDCIEGNCSGMGARVNQTMWTCRAGKHTFVNEVTFVAPGPLKNNNWVAWTVETSKGNQLCERFECTFSVGKSSECHTRTTHLTAWEWRKFKQGDPNGPETEQYDGVWKRTRQEMQDEFTINIAADRQFDNWQNRQFQWRLGEPKAFYLSFWAEGYGYGNSPIVDFVLEKGSGHALILAAFTSSIPFFTLF